MESFNEEELNDGKEIQLKPMIPDGILPWFLTGEDCRHSGRCGGRRAREGNSIPTQSEGWESLHKLKVVGKQNEYLGLVQV